MKAVNILLLCILGAALLSTVLCQYASGPKVCCFKFFRNPVNKNLISSYFMTDSRCVHRGVIFITQKARRICADPNQMWVKNLTDFLDIESF
ncbi:C-C motif chemokine 3-like [Poecilia reticulata]|uniref:C-C motif chemokine 3-like n=1 Tax=Poecilia reticulata TaxID=8081 RepID=UPI0007EA2686|nr:PREDICTED: C-C motif chemokine 3-like [Poecilia reticulata]